MDSIMPINFFINLILHLCEDLIEKLGCHMNIIGLMTSLGRHLELCKTVNSFHKA